jgi:hypothetical protein
MRRKKLRVDARAGHLGTLKAGRGFAQQARQSGHTTHRNLAWIYPLT